MNKVMKKILITSITGLMVGIVPFTANAAEIKTGTAVSSQGVSKVPLTISVSDDETPFESVSLGCEASDSDVSCSFEAATGVVAQGNASKTIFTSGEGFKSGETVIGNLILTNNVTSQKNISYLLKGLNVTVPASKTITISAKQEERVLNADPNLKSIKVSSYTLNPEFNPEVYEYTIYGIPDTVNSVRIETECRASGCSVDDISGGKSVNLKTVTLNQGENTVKVTVSSEDDKNKVTYTLTIIRGDTGYNSSKLKDLSFGDYTLTPAFSKDTKEYTLTVPNSVNSLINVIKYTAEDDKAKISTDGLDNFVVGDNKLTITVDNQTGSETMTYTVTVKRMSNEEIDITKYINDEVTFRDSEGIQTTLSVNEFKTQYPEEWKKIEDGTYKFDENGEIQIEEKENNDEEEKAPKKKKSNVILIVILIVLGLAIIGGSGFLIFHKKKPSKNKDSKKEETLDTEEKNQKTDEEIDETGVEENAIKEEKKINKDETMDIDEALSDLMSTKTYDFKDED